MGAVAPAHQRYGRRPLLALLAIGGLRVGEALGAPRGDLDLHAGRIRVADAKTEAGIRQVELTAFLLDELRAHLAARKPEGLLFPSRTGRPLNASNVRNRLLSETARRANEAREGKLQLPAKITPHTLRRTFASLALAAGRDPRWVMAQLGHTDARLTLNVYAQVMQRQRVDRHVVAALMGFPGESFGPRFGPTADVEAPR